jgi:hypothetical protein
MLIYAGSELDWCQEPLVITSPLSLSSLLSSGLRGGETVKAGFV